MKKMRIKDRERFTDFIIAIVGILTLVIVAKTGIKKPTTWEYHDYIAQGHTYAEWCDYLEGGEM